MKAETARHARAMAAKVKRHALEIVRQMEAIESFQKPGDFRDIPAQQFINTFEGLGQDLEHIEGVVRDMQPLLEQLAHEEYVIEQGDKPVKLDNTRGKSESLEDW